MKKISIVHFHQIEAYPPVLNLILCLEKQQKQLDVSLLTMDGILEKDIYKLKILRFGNSSRKKINLWLNYFRFNAGVFLYLCIKRPEIVLYYETISSFPVFLYKRLFNKSVKVYIHYHEYVSKEEYKNGSKLIKYFHALEKVLIQNAQWVSQTNDVRLKKFLYDLNIEKSNKFHTLPNYPSKKWVNFSKENSVHEHIKIVFVGYSANSNSSYVTELIEWLKTVGLKIQFDLYCIKKEDSVDISNATVKNLDVNYCDPVPYKDLGALLSGYDIGVILYRAVTDNYIFNAPNKLFEYLACGLDVWYPKEMQGIHAYDSEDTPKVKRLDYGKLENYSFNELFSKDRERRFIEDYHAETVYEKLIQNILEN